MPHTDTALTADDIVASVLSFVAHPDPNDAFEPRGFYVSWDENRPDVPQLALVHGLDPDQVALALTELSKPEHGLTLDVHDSGRFAVVLEGDKYALVLPRNYLRGIGAWIDMAHDALEVSDFGAADHSLTTATDQLAYYAKRGWPTELPGFARLQSEIGEAEQQLAAQAPVYVRSYSDDPALRRQLAELVNRFVADKLAYTDTYGESGTYSSMSLKITSATGQTGELILARTEDDGSSYSLDLTSPLETDNGTLRVHVWVKSDRRTGTVRYHSTTEAFQEPDRFLTWLGKMQPAA